MVEVDAGGKELRKVSEEVKEAISKGEPVIIKNAGKCYGLASGLRGGTVKIVGDANDYVGTVNSGAEIVVAGTAGNFLGDNMTSGKIMVSGDAGHGAGIYCYGGMMIVKGETGDFTGTMNKGATLVIGGNVGHDSGTYMTSGELIILGDAGTNLGNYVIRGAIYLAGNAESLGNNMKEVALTEEDTNRLKKLFKENGFEVDLTKMKKMKKYTPETDKPFYKEKSEDLWEVSTCQ